MSSHKISIYSRKSGYRPLPGNRLLSSLPTNLVNPFCDFCCEKRRVQAEIKSLHSIIDLSDKRPYIAQSHSEYHKVSNYAKIPILAGFKSRADKNPNYWSFVPKFYSYNLQEEKSEVRLAPSNSQGFEGSFSKQCPKSRTTKWQNGCSPVSTWKTLER